MTSEQLDDEDEGGTIPRDLHLPRIFVGGPTIAGYVLLGAVLALALIGFAKWCLK